MVDFTAMTAAELQAHPEYATLYHQLLQEWLAEAEILADAKAKEMTLRVLFPNPKEGTTVYAFGTGKTAPKLTLTQPFNRKLDEATLPGTLERMRNECGVITDDLVRYKPELVTKPFRELPAEALAILAESMTTTPGSPGLKYKAAS